MLLASIPSLRAPAVLAIALMLGGCFDAHPCPQVDALGSIASGHLDYAFADGVTTAVDVAPADPVPIVHLEGNRLAVDWLPLLAPSGDFAVIRVGITLPRTGGSFDLITVDGEVCACKKGLLSLDVDPPRCLVGSTTDVGPAECRPPTGRIDLSYLQLGECQSRGGCVDTVSVELQLTAPTGHGLSGEIGFEGNAETVPATCVNGPFH